MAQFETWITRELREQNTIEVLDGALCQGDNGGNRVGVKVLLDGKPYALSGSARGYIVKGDGTTTEVNGLVSENSAWIYLPPAAYSVPGKVQISIRLTDGNEKTVLASCIAKVIRVDTGSNINGNVDYSEIPLISEEMVEVIDGEGIDVP